MVECDLAKVDAEGSNPFRRSIFYDARNKRRYFSHEDHGFFKQEGYNGESEGL